jgi:Putative zinc-finger
MSESLARECAVVDDDFAELALGSLAGRQRAVVLAHLEGCPRCSAEVDTLSAAADELVHVVPAREPPAGFEARVSEHFRTAGRPSRGPAWLAWPRRPALALRALAVLAVVAIGTLAVHQATTPGQRGPDGGVRGYQVSAPTEVAHFRSGTRTVGQVMVYGGHPTWLYMYVDDLAWPGQLTCRVVLADGSTITLGHFRPSAGKGAWAASVSQPASRLREAQLTGADGEVLASAHLN